MNALAKVKSTDLLVIEAMTIVDDGDRDADHPEEKERTPCVRRIRAMEFYHGGSDLPSVAELYHDFIHRNQPLLPNYNTDAKLLIHQQQLSATTTRQSQNNNNNNNNNEKKEKKQYTRRLAV